MITIKLSYTILRAWEQARYEQAIGQYLGQPLPATPEMELGKSFDDLWNRYIDTHGTLPAEFGGDQLNQPRTQLKLQKIIPLNEQYQILIRGVMDCVEPHTIHENKCGFTKPGQYVDGTQLDYYKLLYPAANLGMYHCYNPYFKTYSRGIKFLGRSNAEAALDHIITYGTEFIDYLIVNRLVRNFKMEG